MTLFWLGINQTAQQSGGSLTVLNGRILMVLSWLDSLSPVMMLDQGR